MRVEDPGSARRLVTIDCGNTTIDCRCAWSGRRTRLLCDEFAGQGLRAFLGEARADDLVVVSVAPLALAEVRAAAGRLGARMHVAGVDLPCPLRVAYATPATLGADRWVGCLAAHREAGRAIVVDCGSATTVNAVEADGSFLGGAIGPGLRAIAAGMAQVTPALPPPDLAAQEVAALASSTQAAVDAGVVLGYCGAIERLVAEVAAAMRGSPVVFLTGGNADIVARHVLLQVRPAPDLLHRGLEILAERLSWNA